MIVIQDDMLRDVIARTLHISEEEITEEKLLELKGLSARYTGITSLEGLQHAENLEYLDLCGNSIEILDPIRDLRNIERLNVSKNRLRDLQALHGYRQLKKLDISRNNLYTMDISAVAGMIDLEELNLERSKVDNIIYLEHTKKLRVLHIGIENGPFPISILGTLKNLKELHMNKMWLYSIDDLTYLKSVEVLDLSTNLFSDLSPLTSMKNLRSLDVSNCPYLKDYSVLADMEHLEVLNLSYNHPSHFSFLKKLTHLRELTAEAMAYGARRAREELTAAMQAGYLRPRESGLTPGAGGAFAESPEHWSRQTREELKTRARRGETIRL